MLTLCSNLKIMICSLSGPGGRENDNLGHVCVVRSEALYHLEHSNPFKGEKSGSELRPSVAYTFPVRSLTQNIV